jgi:hypothetical protein
MAILEVGSHRCYCQQRQHASKLVVLTGGPFSKWPAGFFAVTRRSCRKRQACHSKADFRNTQATPDVERCSAQSFTFSARSSALLWRILTQEWRCAIVARLSGSHIGPDPRSPFGRKRMLIHRLSCSPYDAVIHLETQSANGGYNHENPLRAESPFEAKLINDRRLAACPARRTSGTRLSER